MRAGLDLPLRFGFEPGPAGGRLALGPFAPEIQEAADRDPGLPEIGHRQRERHRHHFGTEAFKGLQPGLTGGDDAWLKRDLTVEITKPGNALPVEIIRRGPDRTEVILRGLTKGGQRIGPGLNAQKQREIGDIAGHRPLCCHRVKEGLGPGVRRNEAPARAKPVDITKGCGVSEAAHHIRTIRQRHHPRGQRRRRAPR